MKRFKTIFLFLTIFAIILLTGGEKQTYGQPTECTHTIMITVDSNTGEFTYGDNNTMEFLTVNRGDKICWKCDSPFAIQFKNGKSPITSDVTHGSVIIGTVRSVSSGTMPRHSIVKFISPSARYGTYPYIITVLSANEMFIDDPEVEIPKPHH